MKKLCRTILLLLVILACSSRTASAQRDSTEFRIFFRAGSLEVEPGFAGNSSRLSALHDYLLEVTSDSTLHVTGVFLSGCASLEGSRQFNKYLAKGRLAVMEDAISGLSLTDSIIERYVLDIPWQLLDSIISESALPVRDSLLKIIRSDSHDTVRISRLRNFDNGSAWRWMLDECFGSLRYGGLIVETVKRAAQPALVHPAARVDVPRAMAQHSPGPVYDSLAMTARGKEPVAEPPSGLYIKSNAAGWLLFMANAAFEADLGRHWSLTVPVYFSTINYFAPTVKFRVLGFQPEVRYWFSPENRGWFLGAHFGCAWYNIAVGGAWRYQDHDGDSPALGGGISVGYRLPLSRNGRWNMDFSIGAGAYSVHYDMFHNEPDGLLARTVKRTYWGPDNLEVTISYSFDTDRKAVRKKGGQR